MADSYEILERKIREAATAIAGEHHSRQSSKMALAEELRRQGLHVAVDHIIEANYDDILVQHGINLLVSRLIAVEIAGGEEGLPAECYSARLLSVMRKAGIHRALRLRLSEGGVEVESIGSTICQSRSG